MNLSFTRSLHLSLIVVITIFWIIACGNNLPKNTNSSLSTSQYRIVKQAEGETKVPVNPQRIVALHGSILENLLALNIKPIGTVLNGSIDEQPTYLKDNLANIEVLGSFWEPKLEKIWLLKPDLILGEAGAANIYKQLSYIAPTVLAEYNASDSWKEMLKLHAEALGKPEAAKQILANYYARLEKFKAQMGNRLKKTKVSVVRVYPEGISLYQKDSFCGAILEDAGLSRPPSQNHEGVQQMISKESIQDADGDVIFLWTYSNDFESKTQNKQAILEKLKSDPLWLQLNALRQGKIYQVPDYWIGFGALAADAVIDDLFEYLLDAL